MSDMLETSWSDALADEAVVLMSPRRSGDDDEADEEGMGDDLGIESPDDEFDDPEDLEEEDEDDVDDEEDDDDEDDEDDLDDLDEDEDDEDLDDFEDDGFGDDDE